MARPDSKTATCGACGQFATVPASPIVLQHGSVPLALALYRTTQPNKTQGAQEVVARQQQPTATLACPNRARHINRWPHQPMHSCSGEGCSSGHPHWPAEVRTVGVHPGLSCRPPQPLHPLYLAACTCLSTVARVCLVSKSRAPRRFLPCRIHHHPEPPLSLSPTWPPLLPLLLLPRPWLVNLRLPADTRLRLP